MIETDEIILLQIERGADFLLPIARNFFQENSFQNFSKSQLHALREIIDGSSGFSDMKKKTNEWIQKQAKRKKGQIWKTVRESLPKILFDWFNHEENIIDMTLSGIDSTHTNIDIKEVKLLITKENLMEGLEEVKFRLAKKLFHTLIMLHRCYADEEIWNKIQQFKFVQFN